LGRVMRLQARGGEARAVEGVDGAPAAHGQSISAHWVN
jgi:hypothetical protein